MRNSDIGTLQDAITEKVAAALKIVPRKGKKRQTEVRKLTSCIRGPLSVLKALRGCETGVSYFKEQSKRTRIALAYLACRCNRDHSGGE